MTRFTAILILTLLQGCTTSWIERNVCALSEIELGAQPNCVPHNGIAERKR